MSHSWRRSSHQARPAEAAPGRAGLRLSVRQAAMAAAAALVDATLQFLFAALPISSLSMAGGLSLSIQPAVVVPIFMGLTAGPLAGGLVGLVGRFLGDLLGGQGLNGYSLLYSATLGLVAGLGYRRLTGFRNLRQLGLALGATLLACVLASLFATLLVETLIAHNIAFAAGLNQTLSQIVSGAIIALLLISTPLFVWDRVKKG